MMDTSTSEISGQKKDPLENLSREELIKKCRQFLAIAQKAKQAKDELNEETKALASKLNEVETKSKKDVKAMQEMLNVLTEQKLELVTKIDTFQKEKSEFEGKYEACQQNLHQATVQIQDVDTENQGYQRQVKRLTEENDQLISHLDTLEKRINDLNEIGEQQREQLLLLEKQQINHLQNVDDNKNYEEVEALLQKCSSFETEITNTKLILTEKEQTIIYLQEEIDMLKIKNEQIVQLKNYCQLKNNELECLQHKNQELQELNNNLQVDNANKTENIILLKSKLNENEIMLTEGKKNYDALAQELINTKQTKENYNEKCKLFSKNMNQIFTDVLELKKYKYDLSLVLQSYKEYINTWKSDIFRVINKFGIEVQNRNLEIEKLKLENNNLNQNINRLHENINSNIHENTSHNTEILIELNILKEKLLQKDAKIDNLVDCTKKLNITIEEYKTKVQLDEKLNEEKSVLVEQVNILEFNIIDLKTKLLEKDAKINSDESLLNENSNLTKQLNTVELNIATLTEGTSLLQRNCQALEEQILLHEKKCSKNISDMQDKYSILSKENNKLKSSLSEAQNISKVLNEKVEKMQNNNRILNEENDILKTSISEAQNHSKVFEEKVDETQNIIHILNEENNRLKSSLSEAQNYLKVHDVKVEEILNKNVTLKEENNNLKTSLSEAQNYSKVQQEKVEKMQNKNHILNAENNNLKTYLSEVKNHSIVFEKKVAEMENRIHILNEENNNFKSSISEAQNNSKVHDVKVEEILNKNVTLSEENNNLKTSLSEAQNNSKVHEEKVEDMLNKNEVLNEENNNLKASLSEAKHNSKVYKDKLEQLMNITEKQDDELAEGKKSQEEKILLLSKENNLLKETISGGAKHLEMLTASLSDKNTLESENLKLKSDLSEEKEKNSDLRTENTVARKLTMELQQTSTSLEEAISRNSDFLKIIEGLRDQIENHYIGRKVYENASKSLAALTETHTTLKEKINKYEENLTSYSRDCSDLRNQLSLSKRANAQLLEEMNEMNLALKERGETISKLQELYQELQKQTKTLEQESQTWCKEKGVLEKEVSALKESDREESKALVAEKQKIILDLEGEIKQLKESLNTSIGRDTAEGGYGENETMSTSTISRTEDVARMRDLEGSWEERYAKLRTLALKLKGKVKELTGQLGQERTEKNELQTKISSITKNLQSVQTEYDKIQDQFDNLDKECKKKTKHIDNINNEQQKLKIELNDSKESSSKLQLELDTLRKEKMGSNTAVKQYTTQIQNLKKELETLNEKIKDFTNKSTKLEGTISTKELELQNEIKSHNSTKEKLQKIEKEIKKNSVLSLEMDDYERSLKDLSQKLEKKNETVTQLEQEIETLNSTISSLKTKIKTLETESQSQELQYQVLKQQLSESQAKISSVEAAKAQKDNRIREVLQSYEDYKISSEERNSELSTTVTENQKQLDIFRMEKEHFKSVILGLEDKIRELTKISNDQEQELLHVKDEFSNYKVRAQSVLRQNQTRDVANEERLAEEVNELKIQIDSLTSQSNETTSKLRTVTSEYEVINTEKSQIVLKFEDMEKLLIKEKENNKYLTERQQQLTTEHKEAFRAQKVHLDTLTQCYKQQITEQEERHVKEMTELKAAQAHFTSQAVAKAHEEAIDIASIPREDGEGSESVGSNYAPFRTSVLSLDKLLNAGVETSFDYEAELAQCKKKLVEYEAKIIHLTDLLADTEQDLAKHSQLNQHLKDEIRRHQRSVEREKHAENLEYLKNVVFKFLTLNSGDEKSHLVPVLNTILKLSPDETQKLNGVARGTDPTARGWGSYIPLWNNSSNN